MRSVFYFRQMIFRLIGFGLSAMLVVGSMPAEASVAHDNLAELQASIQQLLVQKQQQAEGLQEQEKEVRRLEETLASDISALRMLQSTQNNMLMLPQTTVEDLERARTLNKTAQDRAARHLQDVKGRMARAREKLQQTEEQVQFTQKHLLELETAEPASETRAALLNSMRQLDKILEPQQQALAEILALQTQRHAELLQLQEALAAMGARLEQEVRQRRAQQLFERSENWLETVGWGKLHYETERLRAQGRRVISTSFWQEQVAELRETGVLRLLTFAGLLALALFFLLKLHRFGQSQLTPPALSHQARPCLRQLLLILHHSVVLLGVCLFLYLYMQTRGYSEILDLALKGLLIWLFSGWALRFWRHSLAGEEGIVAPAAGVELRRMIHLFRYVGLIYLGLSQFLAEGAALLALTRLVFECSLLWCVYRFWQKMPINPVVRSQWTAQSNLLRVSGVKYLMYSIAGGGLVLDMLGFGALAVFWYRAWSLTIVVWIFSTLGFMTIREWQHRRAPRPEAAAAPQMFQHWLYTRTTWLLWGFGSGALTLVAWGAEWSLFRNFFSFLNRPVAFGGIEIAIIGFVYAGLILLLVKTSMRLWRRFLRNQILAESGLEPGLQESISTISVYVAWGLGILFALNILGVSSTSLAVVFGALSLGLGFGLQNIFNNFVSGLILLFERPIQVGDAIEINGIWGEVRQINVRSTLVQTYDNASLIIPNSEFINHQVTNWSFKDMRLRRFIEVGVAYGSDVELTRRTLYEIAEKTLNVLKDPAPMVLFTSFGDSALIFKLRIWTEFNNMLVVENDIRFEIDRLFKERGIEIAFPQRDIHIRSMPEGFIGVREKAKAEREE